MSIPNPATTPWVPLWDTGAGGAAKSPLIPGEIKLWSGKVLPLLADYGLWVWADGTDYLAATYPKAAANIAPEWKTAHGLADPGAGRFRVPDLRGLTPVGLDQMPGGIRANRITRSVAITVAAKTGEETHVVTLAESPAHSHVVNSHSHGGGYHDHGGGWHGHGHDLQSRGGAAQNPGYGYGEAAWTGNLSPNWAGITAQSVIGAEAPGTNNAGGGGAHETMQPSVFVPYIVALDS
jgi:microcystin-dependent protein